MKTTRTPAFANASAVAKAMTDKSAGKQYLLAAALAAMADAARCGSERPSHYASGPLSSNSRAMATARARLASAKE
ncbi:MAG: hypothetical protein EWM72_00387 [Nitrospira sp.]|nr:MAG: hypothetical protein EWM72_00387 [Nitrospira sp.]